MENTS